MEKTDFDGQQAGERVLYIISPHPAHLILAVARVVFPAVLFFVIIAFISYVIPDFSWLLRLIGGLLSLALTAFGVWWNLAVFRKSKSFVTDRRILRFDFTTPFVMTKRGLFWNETLKVKAYAPNLLWRWLNVGVVEVEPVMGERESVTVSYVYYFEDLGNYLDKVLYLFKNHPDELAQLKPFVALPRGNRG